MDRTGCGRIASVAGDHEPLPLCVVCPSAQWYGIEDENGAKRLEAFCTEFRGTMYDHRQRAVTACDARTDAIARNRKPTTSD